MDRTRQGTTGIEILEDILESLKITKEDILEETRITEITLSNMSRVQILAVPAQNIPETVMLKSMVLDPEWFNRDQMKFEDWYRNM